MTDFSLLSSYNYHLPEQLVAQEPGKRGASRLLVAGRDGTREHHLFADLPDILEARYPAGVLLVANNSRVVPVRLVGQLPTGGKCECFVLSPVPLLVRDAVSTAHGFSVPASVLLKPGKTMQVGRELFFCAGELKVCVTAKGEYGHHEVMLSWQGRADTLLELFYAHGHMPLPPYIRRADNEIDKSRYQTVYASHAKSGSAAAPTAGLHFTPEICAELARRGQWWCEVTLHVGYGTFSPVRALCVDDHKMHAEYVECTENTANMVLKAKAEGRAVISVGTTACRTLEGIALACGKLQAYEGFTDIFIRPGKSFCVVDAMLTNFHLPESTLLMLVCAMLGYPETMAAYAEAVSREYRFFSYGDAMLIS